MRALAAYVVRGRLQATLVAAVSALLALILPPLACFSGAAVALVTLRMGLQEGLLLTLAALLVIGGVGWPLLSPEPFNAAFVAILLPSVLVMAVSLRRTARPARSVILATLMVTAAVLTFHLGTDDVVGWWYAKLQESVSEFLPQLAETERLQLMESLKNIAPMMTAGAAAALSISLIASLMLGRWWQAVLYNPGGFGEEFGRFSLGKAAALVLVLSIALLPLTELKLLYQDIFVVLLVPFAVQGLAIVHVLVRQRLANSGWLVALYVLLIVAMGQMILLLAFIGAMDNWFDFRRFFGPKGGAGEV